MSELIECLDGLTAEDIMRMIAKTANGMPFYLQTMGAGGVSFCTQYQTIYDAFTTKPSAAIAEAQNTMWCGMVDDGLVAKLDLFYLFAQEINTGGEALINWINPGTYDATEIPNGGALIFTSLEGLKGDGNAYLDTGWKPNSNGINFIQTNCGFGVYIRDNNAGAWVDIGVWHGSTRRIDLITSSGGNMNWAINHNTAKVIANANNQGFFIVNRTGLNASAVYRNGAQLHTDIGASIVTPDNNLFIFARNNAGPIAISQHQIACAYTGASLDATERTAIQNRIETYMDSNGKGVIP